MATKKLDAKYIIVKWFPPYEKTWADKEMRVQNSTHPRFSEGTLFDFGYMDIASMEGYTITLLPPTDVLEDCWDGGYLRKKRRLGR